VRILIRDEKAGRWKAADSAGLNAEEELQNLLAESPSLIPVGEIREGTPPLVFAVKEFNLPGSGSIDLLAFSPRGDIAIIECKLAANPQAKREVIGQILEYASHMWGMSYEELNDRIQKLENRSLAELVEQGAMSEGLEGVEWDEERFRRGVERTLKTGSFILIVAVDEIGEGLRRMVRYVNECGQPAFSLHALELRLFRAEGIEVLVPHLYGISSRPTRRMGEWDEESFFEALAGNVDRRSVEIVRELYRWSLETADEVKFGTGVETGSFTFYYRLKSGKTSVFTITTAGKLTLNYGALSSKVGHDIVGEFHNKVIEIPGFEDIPPDLSRWPSVGISEAFRDQTALQSFKEAVRWLKGRIESTGEQGRK